MARAEYERENLLRDALAFVHRAEFRMGEREIFIGFRANGCVGLYLNQDPVYHWNSRGELRRAFVDGVPLKSENGRLVELIRRRDAERVTLCACALDVRRQADFLNALRDRLLECAALLAGNDLRLIGETAGEISVRERFIAFLDQIEPRLTIADAPHAV